MSIKKVGILASVLASAVIYSSASSALSVDFTDDSVWGNGGTSDYSATSSDNTYAGGFEVSVTAPGQPANLVFWENADGFGVQGPGDASNWDDDIENFSGAAITEILNVAFSSYIHINTVTLSDHVGDAQYNIGNGWVTMAPTVGNIYTLGGAGNSSSISFRALGGAGNSFQVAGLDVDVAAVPVPAAFWLLGSAMVFLFRKRDAS